MIMSIIFYASNIWLPTSVTFVHYKVSDSLFVSIRQNLSPKFNNRMKISPSFMVLEASTFYQ